MRRFRSVRPALAIAFVVAIAATVLIVRPSQAAELAVGDPSVATELAVEQALLDRLNADRAGNGMPALAFDAETLAIARARAEAQLGAPSLSHYDGSGQLAFVRLLAAAHVGYRLAGENLARSSTDDPATIDRIEQALMQSPTHRQNILDATYTRVAIGAAADPSGRIAFAEIFRSAD